MRATPNAWLCRRLLSSPVKKSEEKGSNPITSALFDITHGPQGLAGFFAEFEVFGFGVEGRVLAQEGGEARVELAGLFGLRPSEVLQFFRVLGEVEEFDVVA